MIYLTMIWNNKILRIILISLPMITCLYFGYKAFYNNVYNQGYNEAVKVTQKKLDDKYNLIVNNIKEENKKIYEIESKKLIESQQIRDKLQKDYIATSKKLNEVINNSKSGLVNKVCVMSQEEKDFFNQ